MVAELADDPGAPERVEEQLRRTRIVRTLERERLRRNITQKDIAKSLGVSVSAVSRLEDMQDADIRLGDIVNYAGAIGLTVSLSMDDEKLPTTDRIKK